MALPSPCAARFYDGQTALEHTVSVALSDDRMALSITGERLDGALRWPLPDLRATGDHAEERQLVLTRHADTVDESPRDPARLVIDDADMIAWLRKTRPNLHRTDLRPGTGKRVAVTLGSAVAAVVVLLFVILPAMANTLATLIPLEREIAFGKSVTAQMERVLGATEVGTLHCDSGPGRAALDTMIARLIEGQEIGYDLDVSVFDHEMVNAFAAPGGQVVLLRGLLEEASGPDAVAAVLAHEIGHVVARDATRAALRTVGSAGLLSLVIGDVTGGALLVLVGEQMLNTSYSRDAENAADVYAIDMLNAARISSGGMGAFFDAISEMQGAGGLPEILSTHPDTGDRAARAKENAERQSATTPSLKAAEWAALQAICGPEK